MSVAPECLVDELVEATGGGGRASCGLGETAEALTLGELRRLSEACDGIGGLLRFGQI
jgi:hypothetical protein